MLRWLTTAVRLPFEPYLCVPFVDYAGTVCNEMALGLPFEEPSWSLADPRDPTQVGQRCKVARNPKEQNDCGAHYYFPHPNYQNQSL